MFDTILLPWIRLPPRRALGLALQLASAYDTELVVAALVEQGRPEPVVDAGISAAVRVIRCRHPARDVVDFAHAHGFDLIVLGHFAPEQSHLVFTHDIARDIVELADVPVLVVAETGAAAESVAGGHPQRP